MHVEITKTWGYQESLIEEFHKATADFTDFDPLSEIFRIKSRYFTTDVEPEPILDIMMP
jgi:phosphoribosylformylglycinamidine synthase